MSKATVMMMSAVLLLTTACGDRDVDLPAQETCHYNGHTYQTGDVFKAADGCNTCSCNPEGMLGVGCSAKKCDGTGPAKDTCHYNGKTYKTGDVFPALDGCNSCSCNPHGHVGVGCTKKGCPDLGTPDAGAGTFEDAYGGNKCGFEGTVCGSMCVNLKSDPMHCGQCFNACKSGEVCNGTACVEH